MSKYSATLCNTLSALLLLVCSFCNTLRSFYVLVFSKFYYV
jgi:hypothetical protein